MSSEATASLSQGGYWLIGNLCDVRVPLPIEIAHDLRIERPNADQLAVIHDHLSRADPYTDLRFHFETHLVPVEGITGARTRETLPEADWKYLIAAYAGHSRLNILDFFYACSTVEPTLFWIASIGTAGAFGVGATKSYGLDSTGIHARHLGFSPDGVDVIDATAVQRVRDAYNAIVALDRTAYRGPYRSTELLELFGRLPMLNFLDPLALFMIIEMFLTHNPGDREIGDSLSHQIREKIPFVLSRAGETLDYSVFQAAASPETLWTKLYEYRSAVAHGGNPDFGSKLRILKDAVTANRFLWQATRRLVRFA